MTEPILLEHSCHSCDDRARGYSRVELQRWFIWHVYWCHLDLWIEKVGSDRLPQDPKPTPFSIVTTAPPGTRGTLTAPSPDLTDPLEALYHQEDDT